MRRTIAVVAAAGAAVAFADAVTPPEGAASSFGSAYLTISAGPGCSAENGTGATLDSRISTAWWSDPIPLNTNEPKGMFIFIR